MSELSSVTIALQPQRNAQIPAWLGRAAQAHFLHTLAALNPILSSAIHDAQGAKPFTSSTLIGARKSGEMVQLSERDKLYLRYTTLHPQLTKVFHRGMLPQWDGSEVLLHNQPLKVVSVENHGLWSDQSDYVKLVDHAPLHYKVTMNFTSPTSFKRTAGGFTPLPQPELVFSSLLDRWNAFAPFRLPDWLYDTIHRDIVIDQARIQTETLSFARGHKGVVTGFTGRVTYRLLCYGEACRYLNALARFAKFSGVGVKTSVGMGQVKAA